MPRCAEEAVRWRSRRPVTALRGPRTSSMRGSLRYCVNFSGCACTSEIILTNDSSCGKEHGRRARRGEEREYAATSAPAPNLEVRGELGVGDELREQLRAEHARQGGEWVRLALLLLRGQRAQHAAVAAAQRVVLRLDLQACGAAGARSAAKQEGEPPRSRSHAPFSKACTASSRRPSACRAAPWRE